MFIKHKNEKLEIKIVPRELTAVIVGEGTEALMLLNCPCPKDQETLEVIKKKVKDFKNNNKEEFENYLLLNKTLLEGDKHES